VLLPHLRNRPLTIKRHYTVPRGPFEWVKDAPPEMPDWIRTCPQPAKSRGGALVRYPLANSTDALLWAVEYGAVDLHLWTARCDRPDRPDYVLFDLDPAGGAGTPETVAAAEIIRVALDALGLESFVRTTGGDGLHVLVSLARRHTHAEAREFADVVGGALRRASGGLVTLERSKSRRPRGVFLDTKMNGHGQQIACAYSVRPRPGAPVATPLAWDELTEALDPAAFTLPVVVERAATLGDLAEPLLQGRQRIDRALSGLRA
jgi:bifunctional non-homologous end joining protein LigD